MHWEAWRPGAAQNQHAMGGRSEFSLAPAVTHTSLPTFFQPASPPLHPNSRPWASTSGPGLAVPSPINFCSALEGSQPRKTAAPRHLAAGLRDRHSNTVLHTFDTEHWLLRHCPENPISSCS